MYRESIDKTISITRIPSPSPGAQMNFYETLDTILGAMQIESENEVPIAQIKLSADGAKVSRCSNFIVFSIALLNTGQDVMSSDGQHTLAIVDSPENFVSLKESFAEILSDINALLKRGENGHIPYISQAGQEFKLEFFLRGDMKFLLMVLGLNSANTNFSCLYCKIDKKMRHDMSKPESYYSSEKMIRSVEEMKKLHNKKPGNFGSIHSPLLEIDINHVVIDELHLMLRVMDIRNLIEDAVNMDQKHK
jgi:glutaredoxin